MGQALRQERRAAAKDGDETSTTRTVSDEGSSPDTTNEGKGTPVEGAEMDREISVTMAGELDSTQPEHGDRAVTWDFRSTMDITLPENITVRVNLDG